MKTGMKGRALVQVARVSLALVVGLAAVEIAFRIRDSGAFPHLNVYEPDSATGVRLRPLATTRLAFGGSAVTDVAIHSGGFRGRTAEAEPPVRDGEVLFVGDSQTFGLGVEAGETFAARFGELAKMPVYNAGVPTWGPPEFARTIEVLGKRRRPKTVVYVVNFANDPFEANRPNRERHVAWDGWAVRRETAPAHVLQFPGRGLLFARSHAIFAIRQWWHRLGAPVVDERGTPSEGTFRDLYDVGRAMVDQRAADRAETERRAALYEMEMTYAEESYRRAESRVRALVWANLKLGDGSYLVEGAPATVYLAADANPGDIVSPGYGEEGRPVFATADYIRQAAELRSNFEAKLRAQANAALDSDAGKEILMALSARDAERLRMEMVQSKPLEIVRRASPLARAVLEAKARTEALGARFVLLVLPLDVMVSPAEWKKHAAQSIDLAPAGVLVDDLVEVVRDASGVAVDARATLAKAEPGAFLPADIHLTPKGHEAVAKALFDAITAKPAPRAPMLALGKGRSRVPPPETWTALAGQVAVVGSGRCPVTKKYREWLYVTCYSEHETAPRPTGILVTRGTLGDSIATVADGRMTLVAAVPKGQRFEALFSWSDGVTKRLLVDWDPSGTAPDMRMVGEKTESAPAPARKDVLDELCACHKTERRAADCSELIAEPDPDCVATYAGDCARMLACAEGNALYPPRCRPGLSNTGATMRCAETRASSDGPTLTLTPPPALSKADERALEDKGRKVVVSAQAFVGDGCKLDRDQVEIIAVIPFDRCPVDATMVAAYDAALKDFDGIASRSALDGSAATYAEKARLFGSWVHVTQKSKDTRGTAALYQDLALSFNAWQPKTPVWVDSPRLVKLFFGVAGVPTTDYFRNLHKDGEKRRAEFLAAGRRFVWRRGPNGFEGPFGSAAERIVGGY